MMRFLVILLAFSTYSLAGEIHNGKDFEISKELVDEFLSKYEKDLRLDGPGEIIANVDNFTDILFLNIRKFAISHRLKPLTLGDVKENVQWCMVESPDAELNHIKEDLHRNGYPKKLLEEVLKQLRRTKTSEEPQQSTVICLPYIRGVSEKIRRIGNKFNIESCFQSGSTLRSFLTKTKPDNKNEISKNCIYEVPCEFGDSYIGETKKPLSVRLDEQQEMDSKSGIADHAWTEHHRVLWDDASVLHREEHWFKRKFKEAAYIEANNAFSQPSIEIKNVWKPLIVLSGGLQGRETSRTTNRAKLHAPLHLAELHASLHRQSYKLFLASSVELTKGTLNGLSILKRYDNVTVKYKHDLKKLEIDLPIWFSDLHFYYHYHVILLLMGPEGNMMGLIPNFKVHLKLSFDFNTNRAQLEQVKVTNSGFIELFFEGGILDEVSEILSQFVTVILHPILIGIIERNIKTVANTIVTDVNTFIDGMLHPHTPNITVTFTETFIKNYFIL